MSLRLATSLVALVVLGAGAARAQSPPPLAESEVIGTGTPGSTGIPRLRLVGRAAIGEPGPALQVEAGAPGARALIVVGAGVGNRPLPALGGTLYAQLPAARFVVGPLDAQGSSSLLNSGPAPLSAALLGLDFVAQGLVLDPAAQGGAALTAGLRLRGGAGFAAPGLFAGLGYPASATYTSFGNLTTGDFDGDGRRDLALEVAASGAARIAVFRQLNDGSFAPPVTSITFQGASALLPADLDSDGHLDLVMLAHGYQVAFLPGLGDGSFAAPQVVDVPAGGNPKSLAVADVTGDGQLDVLVAEWGDKQLGVLPSFPAPGPPPASFPLWGDASALRVGDVTGDGTPDAVALVWAPGHYLSVLRGLGGGSFELPTLSATGLVSPICLELGDLDGDGDLDAAVGFAPTVTSLNLPNVLILANDGGGNFSPASLEFTTSFNTTVQQLELADVEPDGDLDLLVVPGPTWGYSLHPVTLLANLGAGDFAPPQPLVPRSAIDAADMDGDGRLDIAGVAPEFVAAAYCDRGLGGGVFDITEPLPGLALFPAGAADFDGDGDLDLAGQLFDETSTNRIAVSLWTAPLGFGPPTLYDAHGDIPDLDGLGVADADGDGRPDVVAAGDDTVRIFRGDGAGGLLTPDVVALPDAAVPRVADMDGDGRPDLVVSRMDQGLSVLLGLPGGGFAAPVTTPADFDHFDVGDVDGDGRPDVVAQGLSGFHVLSGTGDGHFAAAFVPAPGSGDSKDLPLLLADFDGDGDLDLARLDFAALVSIWSNDGQAGFSLGQQSSMTDYTFTLAAADFNLDGALDLLGSELRLGFGDGSFAAPHPGIAAGALGDFDGDGDVDVFVNGYLFFNRVR